ncbi:hypothetical protein E8E12_010724 [Didymella heteroderae]|uniref:Uncharacterized protein n=1 Tax=Didymella heteroderae TaxID=1769908 RepID=A0A9P4X1V4_9PLEO|nr:hypothetical protein E8E12_010724 [Didymella heteroderae]
MAFVGASVHPLPTDLAITERSRRFYDGTYKWDSDGFTDEHGVYREYDCMDPLARAPTPLPPMFLYNEEEEEEEEEDNGLLNPSNAETTRLQDSCSTMPSTESAAAGLDTPFPKPDSTVLTTDTPRTPGSIRRFAINLLKKHDPRQAAPQDHFDVPSWTIEDTTDVPEGTEPGSEPGEIVERQSSSMKMPDTPPASPTKMLSMIQNTSPASTISTSSPVPSNLSEQDKNEGIEMKGASIAHDAPSLPATPSRASPPKRKGTATRGVAQRVTKASKRASINKSSPPKRKENSVEKFTLLELHSGAFLRKGGLRKSARQAKAEGN